MTQYPTPNAIVLTPGCVFYDNGRVVKLHSRFDLSDPAAVLAGAARTFLNGEGVVVVDGPMPESTDQLGDWTFTGLRGWTTFARRDGAIVHVGWLPELERTGKLGALLKGHDGAADIAWRLGRYKTVTGSHWRYTAGVSGCVGLRSFYTDPRPGKQPLWQFAGPMGIRGGGPMIWRRAEQPEDSRDGQVVMFDINAAYLAALKNVKLAWGALQHTGPTMFDPDWPGFWEIDTTSLPDTMMGEDGHRPPLVTKRQIHKGAAWVSTPLAKYLSDTVGSIDVLDSWTCSNGETIARGYAERLMKARAGDFGPLGPASFAVKRTYAELVGMMAREGGSIFRRDWSASTMDLSTCNMMRRADRAHELVGTWPIQVRTDALFYLIPPGREERVQRLAMALGVGSGPGTFKNGELLTVDAYRGKLRVPV